MVYYGIENGDCMMLSGKVVTNRAEIVVKKELQEIYEERSKWSEINKNFNYVIPYQEITKRELILSLQQILYKIEDAKKYGDKNKENFNLDLYYLIKSTIE